MSKIVSSISSFRAYHQPRPLIASHKGRNCGLISESTVRSFTLALRDGADIIETDVSRAAGGEMILMHGPNLDRYTDGTGPIANKSIDELRQLHLRSCNGCAPEQQLLELPDFLARYKNVCLINLDRCFDFLPEAFEQIKAHDMIDQVLLKSDKALEDTFHWLEKEKGAPQFMPVIKDDMAALEFVLDTAQHYAYPAVELVFAKDDAKIMSPELVKRLHDKNIKIWVNSLSLHFPLCGGRDDLRSLFDSPDAGWGWLCDHGVDVIQTDFVHELRVYLDQRFAGAK